jgi:hypothetical protein
VHDLTEVKDEDLNWDGCTPLNDTTRDFGGVVLYCDGPKSVGNSTEDLAGDTTGKEISSLNPTLKAEPTNPKPWWVPFWKGLLLYRNGYS